MRKARAMGTVVTASLSCLLSLLGCGDDKEESSASPRVAAACQKACQKAQGAGCALGACVNDCEAMQAQAPACVSELELALECTANASSLACSENSLIDDECNYGDWLMCAGKL